MPMPRKKQEVEEVDNVLVNEVEAEPEVAVPEVTAPVVVVPEQPEQEQTSPEQPKQESEQSFEQPEQKSEQSPDQGPKMTMKGLVALLSKTANVFADELMDRDARLDGHDGDLKNHEQRIATLELRPESSAPVNGVIYGFTGPSLAYKYWDWKNRTHGITPEVWKARQIDMKYEGVYVWYVDGQIDHVLDNDELVRYIP